MHHAALAAGLSILLLAGGSTAATAAPSAQDRQPAVTGSMYNGNNTQAPELKLQGRMAPITEALEPTAAFAPHPNQDEIRSGGELGGNSSTARPGGGG